MTVTGSVVDSASGAAVPGATVWEMASDGRSASVLGYADGSGNFNVNANGNLQLMFSADNYTSASLLPYQVAESGTVALDKDGTMSANIQLKFPTWLWAVLGVVLLIGTQKKKR